VALLSKVINFNHSYDSVSILPPSRIAFNVDHVRVSKLLGSGVTSSSIVNGMLFIRECESK